MAFIREENRDFRTNDTVVRNDVPHLVYRCPHLQYCTNGSRNDEIAFKKGKVYTNPFNHPLSCYKPKAEQYREVYDKLLASKNLDLGNEKQIFAQATREQAFFSYLHFIVTRKCPTRMFSTHCFVTFQSIREDLVVSTL